MQRQPLRYLGLRVNRWWNRTQQTILCGHSLSLCEERHYYKPIRVWMVRIQKPWKRERDLSWSIKRQAHMGLNAGASLKDKLETGVVAVVVFVMKWRGRKGLHASQPKIVVSPRNSMLMTCHPVLGRDSISLEVRPIRSTTQIRVITCHHYGKSTLVPQTSFRGSVGCFLNFLLQAYLLRLSPLLRPPNFHST